MHKSLSDCQKTKTFLPVHEIKKFPQTKPKSPRDGSLLRCESRSGQVECDKKQTFLAEILKRVIISISELDQHE